MRAALFVTVLASAGMLDAFKAAGRPMTAGVILETGFLTSPRDRRVIVHGQDRAARGIADAVIQFLSR